MEAEKIRDRILERGDLKMTKEQFNTYFMPEGQAGVYFKQQAVGNCGGLAGLHALSCCDWFEFFVRHSSGRKSEKSWELRMPFINESGRTVEISPKDFSLQWNSSFLKKGSFRSVDPRPMIGPIKSLEGVQALEAAFILSNNKEATQKIKGPISGTERRMTEGIKGDDTLVLFGGELFEKCGVEANWKTESEAAREAGNYGRLSLINEECMARLDHCLENWDSGLYLATAELYNCGGKIKIKGVKDKIFSAHHYSVAGVDAKRKVITLGNPHDTFKLVELTFDQFKKNFTGFWAVKINSAKLLEKMKRSGKEG